MRRFASAVFIILLMLLGMSMVFADGNDNSFALVKDWKDAKVYEADQAIYGTAAPGTVISFSLYGEGAKSVVELDRSGQSSWKLVASDKWTVGASGVFVDSITLQDGKNKMVFEISYQNNTKETRTYFVEYADKDSLLRSFHDLILKPGKDDRK